MSNGKELERLWKLQTQVNKLVMECKRDPTEVADALQEILEEKRKKFKLFKDLGFITVPSDYVSRNYLNDFFTKNSSLSVRWDHHAVLYLEEPKHPKHILKRGETLHVQVYCHDSNERLTTTYERMWFLRSMGAVFTGMQGALLVLELKHAVLPRGKWYVSMDEDRRILTDHCDRSLYPVIDVYDDGEFFLRARGVDSGSDRWTSNELLLVFTSVQNDLMTMGSLQNVAV